MKLEELGWNSFFAENFERYEARGLIPGRVIRQARHLYSVVTERDELQAEISGHFHYTAIDSSDFPAVGDWVALRDEDSFSIIEAVLPRHTFFSRKAAGDVTREQVIAANIDVLCIVCGLDGGRNFTLRGIERYLALANSGGAKPLIVLNKADLCEDTEAAILNAQSVSGSADIFLVSALSGEGIEDLLSSFKAGQTIAFTGPSGVGKSALTNALAGKALQKTGAQREDDKKGRHTTTHREIFTLPGGALVIDTPGLRELQLWGDEDGLNDTFTEIYEAAQNCRFTDCTHSGEPGCAVQKAVAEGLIDPLRLNNYLDMQSEIASLERRKSEKGRLEQKQKDKQLAKMVKQINRIKENR